MSTQTTHPTPVGPAGLPSDLHRFESLLLDSDTEQLEATSADLILDALPLVDRRSRGRTIAPHLALRGHYLELSDGSTTELLKLENAVTRVGRGAGSDVRLEEHRVSREHAILVRHGRYFRLLDNRSFNGTFVNGRRIVTTNVSSGDVIDLGPVRLRYVEVL
jgi:hypothetical protein